MSHRRHRRLTLFAVLLALMVLTACGPAASPTATTAPPTATTAPPTATTVPPTATTAPPTATTAPPTATAVPASPTPAAQPAAKPAAEAGTPSKPSGASPSSKPSAPVPPEVVKAMTGLADAKSFSTKMTGTIGAGEQLEATMEYAAPDRLRLAVKGAKADQSFQIVSIGATSYVKMGDTPWVKNEGSRDSFGDLFSAADLRESIKDLDKGTYKREADEAVDGEACIVFSFTETDGDSGRLWIAKGDNLPRKMTMKSDDSEMTMLISGINKPVSIEPPIP